MMALVSQDINSQEISPNINGCYEIVYDSDGNGHFIPMECCEFTVLVPVFLPMVTIYVPMTVIGACPP